MMMYWGETTTKLEQTRLIVTSQNATKLDPKHTPWAVQLQLTFIFIIKNVQ